jgi:hypothetical protein
MGRGDDKTSRHSIKPGKARASLKKRSCPSQRSTDSRQPERPRFRMLPHVVVGYAAFQPKLPAIYPKRSTDPRHGPRPRRARGVHWQLCRWHYGRGLRPGPHAALVVSSVRQTMAAGGRAAAQAQAGGGGTVRPPC